MYSTNVEIFIWQILISLQRKLFFLDFGAVHQYIFFQIATNIPSTDVPKSIQRQNASFMHFLFLVKLLFALTCGIAH